MSEENQEETEETTETEETRPEYSPARPRRRRLRNLLRLTLMILGPAAVLVAGGYFYISGGRIISTENAYVKADKIAISTNVPGRVTAVLVGENDDVEMGAILFRLNAEPYQITLDRTEAKLAATKQEINELRAIYRQKIAELNVLRSDIDYLKNEYGRQQKLKKRGVVSQARLDEARQNVNNAKQRILAIRQEISRALARLGGDTKLPTNRHPRVMEARAERARAALELSRTVISAPETGVVTNISLEPGEFVKAGTPIFSVVATDQIWVEANLKETDLTNVQVGQFATVKVDSYPDLLWRARVGSISMATGAEFSLLPPQNATGNWVKVVQRIPVKLSLLDSAYAPQLRAGMSVVVEIDTLHERKLPSFIKDALAWVRNGER